MGNLEKPENQRSALLLLPYLEPEAEARVKRTLVMLLRAEWKLPPRAVDWVISGSCWSSDSEKEGEDQLRP